VAKAIAAYERTILSGNAPYDRFRAGDANALSVAARRGLTLFERKARCAPCHAAQGRLQDADAARRGPRPPYMHDGSLRAVERDPPLGLTAQEQQDLVAFLEALTGEVAKEVSSPPVLPE
jgi:cytochrome c peroxidase